MTVDEFVSVMVERIAWQFQPTRILLFGSRARGDAGESSDIDLLVVMRGISDKRQAAVEMRQLLRDLPVSKDIIVTTPDEISERGHVVGTLIHEALREGRVVYERDQPGGMCGPGQSHATGGSR